MPLESSKISVIDKKYYFKLSLYIFGRKTKVVFSSKRREKMENKIQKEREDELGIYLSFSVFLTLNMQGIQIHTEYSHQKVSLKHRKTFKKS